MCRKRAARPLALRLAAALNARAARERRACAVQSGAAGGRTGFHQQLRASAAPLFERTHAGFYRVIARNELGNCEESFSLAVLRAALRVRVCSRIYKSAYEYLYKYLNPPACTVRY